MGRWMSCWSRPPGPGVPLGPGVAATVAATWPGVAGTGVGSWPRVAGPQTGAPGSSDALTDIQEGDAVLEERQAFWPVSLGPSSSRLFVLWPVYS